MYIHIHNCSFPFFHRGKEKEKAPLPVASPPPEEPSDKMVAWERRDGDRQCQMCNNIPPLLGGI